MRAVINISLPQQLVDVVGSQVESGRYASKSEFFRHLLRMWMENSLYNELEKSRSELEQGKGKILKSLKDLR